MSEQGKTYREWNITSLPDNDDAPDVSIFGPNADNVHVVEIQALNDANERIKELEKIISEDLMSRGLHDSRMWAEDQKFQSLDKKLKVAKAALDDVNAYFHRQGGAGFMGASIEESVYQAIKCIEAIK